jgi:hypothetical protein
LPQRVNHGGGGAPFGWALARVLQVALSGDKGKGCQRSQDPAKEGKVTHLLYHPSDREGKMAASMQHRRQEELVRV